MVIFISVVDARKDDADAYAPQMNDAYWAVIRDFVLDTTRLVAEHVPYPPDATRRAVAGLTLWAWLHAGLPLERDRLFRRDVIAHYVDVGCPQLNSAARGNRRSILFRVTETLDHAPHRPPPLPPSDPTSPYSQGDIVSLLSWARGQTTPDRRRNAHALIALGLGAGASAQEIIDLTNNDVLRVDDATVDIHLPGPRSRIVPMVSEWAHILPHSPGPPGEFFFRPGRTMSYANAIANFVARGPTHGIRPQSQRLRTTWIVRHLDAGTNVRTLTEAAGVESLEALTRYIRFTKRLPDHERQHLLRHPGTPLPSTTTS